MKYIVDIKGEIDGDYEIIGKYEERPQGKWIYDGFYSTELDEMYSCSICGRKIHTALHDLLDCHFCLYCGADMRVEEE